MAQVDRQYPLAVYALNSFNLGINVFFGFETVVLDQINAPSITNFAMTAKNNSIAGNLTTVSVYVSPNNIDYFLYEANLLPNSLAPGGIQFVEFTVVALYIRITTQSDANINIDIHLQGSLT